MNHASVRLMGESWFDGCEENVPSGMRCTYIEVSWRDDGLLIFCFWGKSLCSSDGSCQCYSNSRDLVRAVYWFIQFKLFKILQYWHETFGHITKSTNTDEQTASTHAPTQTWRELHSRKGTQKQAIRGKVVDQRGLLNNIRVGQMPRPRWN